MARRYDALMRPLLDLWCVSCNWAVLCAAEAKVRECSGGRIDLTSPLHFRNRFPSRAATLFACMSCAAANCPTFGASRCAAGIAARCSHFRLHVEMLGRDAQNSQLSSVASISHDSSDVFQHSSERLCACTSSLCEDASRHRRDIRSCAALRSRISATVCARVCLGVNLKSFTAVVVAARTLRRSDDALECARSLSTIPSRGASRM